MRRTDSNTLIEAAAPRRGPVNPDHASWQPADDERLSKLFNDGATDAAIADALGRSKKAVGLRRVGLGMRREATYPDVQATAEARAAAVLRADAVGAAKAADEIGVHERSIVRWRNGHTKRVAPHKGTGPQRVSAPWSADDNNTVRSMFAAGKSDHEIGAVVGRAAGTVGEQRRALGLRYRAQRSDKKTTAPATAAKKPRTTWKFAERKQLRALFAQGLSDEAIADRIGRSVQGVKFKRTSMRLHRRGPYRSQRTAPVARAPRRTSLARRALVVAPAVAACAAAAYALWAVLS